MVAGKVVIDALISIGKWVAKNPDILKDAADKVVNLKPNKKTKDTVEPTVDDKLNQLGEAVLEINQKFDIETSRLSKELRAMKIALSIVGALLGAAIVAIVFLAIL